MDWMDYINYNQAFQIHNLDLILLKLNGITEVNGGVINPGFPMSLPLMSLPVYRIRRTLAATL
jgi:hypothetical protein